MITFNGKPLCDMCYELPIAVHFDGWDMCCDCLLSYQHSYEFHKGNATSIDDCITL